MQAIVMAMWTCLSAACTLCLSEPAVLGNVSSFHHHRQSPVAWSADGQHLAFVSGNHSIYICAWAPEAGRFKVKTLLNGHRMVVKCLTFHPG